MQEKNYIPAVLFLIECKCSFFDEYWEISMRDILGM